MESLVPNGTPAIAMVRPGVGVVPLAVPPPDHFPQQILQLQYAVSLNFPRYLPFDVSMVSLELSVVVDVEVVVSAVVLFVVVAVVVVVLLLAFFCVADAACCAAFLSAASFAAASCAAFSAAACAACCAANLAAASSSFA